MYLQNRGDEEEFFFSFPSQKFSLSHHFTPKGHFSIISTEKFLLQTATTLQRLFFFFFLREVHTFTLVYNGHFLLSPRWLKEVRQLCSTITSQKRPTRKIFPLFPMVLFLFSPRELIKRPSLGRLN